MKKMTIILMAVMMHMAFTAEARESVNDTKKRTKSSYKTEAGDCVTPTAQFDLDINNVRARLLTGGDLWWNLSEARYQVPKGDGTGVALNAIFAGAIWITGEDAGGNLKGAAQRYRGGGDDYWPGPIGAGAVIDKATCSKYDRFFNVLGSDVENARAAFAQKGTQTTLSDIPRSVLAWPGRQNPYLATDPSLLGETFVINDNLAPFFDADNDGIYDPLKGDHPVIPCRGTESEAFGDQMIFWVINDVGNQHTETNGQSIGVQVNCLAFAFQTTDEINNMTFYKYEIVNKSSNPLLRTYVSQWSDPDLGCFSNDRVGCDVPRALGIVYNGSTPDNDCQGVAGYGAELPLIGIDFFEGPLSDSGQQLGLSSFVYFTNGATVSQTDPSSLAQYRNYMTGFWNDGTPFTFGGTGYNSGGPVTNFIFPGNPIDPNQWSEVGTGVTLPSGDRRMVQTSGPFTLKPGEAQFVTVGVVFVRPAGGVGLPPNFATTIGPADDKAQALFNTCFKLVDGPAAPTLQIRELDKSLIINLVNLPGSNNFGESYDQVDGTIAQIIQSDFGGVGDSTYTFEGYKLYQLSSANVSATELEDPTKARLVAQVDVRNNVTSIINFVKNPILNLNVPVLKVNGNNAGITNTFRLTDDLFAQGTNKSLVNHRTYYYTAVAYAHNNYKQFDQDNPTAGGQLTAFLQGRGNFRVYSAIPHIPDPRNEGTVINSVWGEGVEVKRIEGTGNGSNKLLLTPKTVEQILASGSYAFGDTLTYQKGFDPIGLRVIDPISVVESDFELQFVEDASTPVGNTTTWFLRDLSSGDTIFSERPLDRPYEQQISAIKNGQRVSYGFSIKLGTPSNIYTIPSNYPAVGNPLRLVYRAGESQLEYENPVEPWLRFVRDEGSTAATNWIRSGTTFNDPNSSSGQAAAAAEAFDDNHYYTSLTPPATPQRYTDSSEFFENILNGTWAPYCLAANYAKKNLSATEAASGKPPYVYGPGFKWRNYGTSTPPQNTLDKVSSVDIVITPDRSKWSRCVVFETGEDEGINQGSAIAPNSLNARKGQIRMAISKVLDGNGNLVTDPTEADTGRSWFPGYAINVETGERLNICFGESSDQGDQNGRDMLWNPTSNLFAPISTGGLLGRIPYFGGKHFIYVMDTKYDEGAEAQRLLLDNYNKITSPQGGTIPAALHPLYRSLMWTSIPYLTPGYQFQTDGNGVRYIPPAEVSVKLRVEKPFNRFETGASNGIESLPRYQFSTKGLGTTEKNSEVAKNALDIIRVVPNPYLAYSAYETDQNSNIVKITNLPNNCNITVYALDGTIIRRLSRAIGVDPVTQRKIEITDGSTIDRLNLDNTVNWDLKNDRGITISSGLYLIHVEAPGIGERTIKWFGAVRPADTSNF